MEEREILSLLKYVSSIKSGFLLSEMQQYLSEALSLEEILRLAAPHLAGLQLSVQKIDGDYAIERIPSARVLELSGEEQQRILTALGAREFPHEIQNLIQQYMEKKVGKPLEDPVVLERLRRAIVAQKGEYWKEGKNRGISYQKGYSVLGYLAYHAPVYFTQFQHILLQMAEGGLLKTRMRILDVGTGPGVIPLAIVDFFKNLGRGEAHIYAIDKFEENLEAYQYLVTEYGQSVDELRVEQPLLADALNLLPDEIPGNLDILIFSIVLNELKLSPVERADLVLRYAEKLALDGTIIIVEPADLVNSTEMRKTVISLLDRGLFMYAPCTFLWGVRCRSSACWSFAEQESIHPTRLMEALAGGTDEPYRYINTDIKYSYALLRKDRRAQVVYQSPSEDRFARLSKLASHVKRRINVIAAVMSGDLGDSRNHIFKLCDGTAKKPVYAILPRHHESEKNAALRNSGYGEIVEIFQVLVRYNPKHDAYNLLVERNTRVVPASDQRQPGRT